MSRDLQVVVYNFHSLDFNNKYLFSFLIDYELDWLPEISLISFKCLQLNITLYRKILE